MWARPHFLWNARFREKLRRGSWEKWPSNAKKKRRKKKKGKTLNLRSAHSGSPESFSLTRNHYFKYRPRPHTSTGMKTHEGGAAAGRTWRNMWKCGLSKRLGWVGWLGSMWVFGWAVVMHSWVEISALLALALSFRKQLARIRSEQRR